MGPLIPNVKPQFFDTNGDPLSGGFLYVYTAGTSAAIATYSEPTLTTPNASPIVLDSRGECDLWLADGTYKFVLKDSDDVTIWTVDNITIADTTSAASLVQKYTTGYAALTDPGLTVSATLFSLPAKTVIEYLSIKHSELFAASGLSSLLISVGITGDLTLLVDSFDVLQTVDDTEFWTTDLNYIASWVNTTDIIISAVAVGANLDALSAGSVDVYAKLKGIT